MTRMDNLSPYEKGVIARWLLGELIERGRIENEGIADLDISISVKGWQLEFLAQFCKSDKNGTPGSSVARQPHLDLREILQGDVVVRGQ